jgi:SAC3 domain-containing protein 1
LRLISISFFFSFPLRILFDQQKPFSFRYDFIFDRCRAIRQEIVIQNFPCDATVKILEPIVMFLSFSMYRLSGSSIAVFDPKICLQHLQECLLKCLTCYDEMESGAYDMNRRIVVEGIYLMLNMDDTSALQRAIQLNASIKSEFILRTSIQIALNFHLKNFYKLLRAMQELPHVIAAIASLKLPAIRKEIFGTFAIAYNSATLNVPLDFLQRLLLYDATETLVRDLNSFGIQCSDEKLTAAKFERKKFDSSKSIVSI